jgi:PEP-CTERM motif
MKVNLKRLLALMSIIVVGSIFATLSSADPLPGQVLKFDQKPMIATTIAAGGQIQTYFGHDELSTAYGVGNTANPPTSYRGIFMADDFADKFSTPVAHITWWGSYLDNNNAAFPPQPPVQKFLIAFETDVPQGPGEPFSHPGTVIQHEVVTLGNLSPGTFTETLERPADPVLGEALYRYNAELKLPFAQQPDTVYWLKIAALVDVPQPIVVPIPPGTTQWGWHNRDYTINDPQASTAPAVNPGEFIDGNVPGTNLPIWHFQDDAVQGNLDFIVNPPAGTKPINQFNMSPTHYQFVNSNGVGPIDGPQGIELKSKDLAFRLYTVIPEPASCLLMAVGLAGVFATRRRSRVAK